MRKNPTIFRAATPILLALSLAMTLVPAATAQGTQEQFWASTTRTHYIHLAQYCDRNTALIRWMDEFDWKNDLDGCGGNVLDPTTTKWTDVFPSFTPFHANATTETTAEMHIFILSRAVDQTTVEATFDLGYATCRGRNGPALIVQEKVGGFHEFIIPCTFEVKGPTDSVVKPKLTITVTATYTYGYGTEGKHASYVKLANVVPAPPTQKVEFFEESARPLAEFEEEKIVLAELPEAKADGKAPAAGTIATLVVLGILVASLGRWHRRS